MHKETLPFELTSLARAYKYQKWLYSFVEPYLGNAILEMGAGIGNMSQWLPVRQSLILNEIEPALLSELKINLEKKLNSGKVLIVDKNILENSNLSEEFKNVDTIVSFNVLEHIAEDREIIKKLIQILHQSKSQETKRLISFVPAHAWAYGTLDKEFGHFRRYSKSSMAQLFLGLNEVSSHQIQYCNLLGLFSWIVSGKLLKIKTLSKKSIQIVEFLLPVFRVFNVIFNRFLNIPLGQSLISVVEIKNAKLNTP